MATRARIGGSIAVQYEDFQPNSEWKEEEGANLLLIPLPDFKKEQLKITYEHSNRVLRAAGERPITGNKWSRFNQTFSVPQNCEVQKIQGKFQNGILTITMPKITITQPPIPSKSAPTNTVKQGNEKKETPQETKTEQKQTDRKKMEAVEALSPKEGLQDTLMKQKDENQKSIGKKEMSEQEESSKKRKESLLAESNKKRKEGGTKSSSVVEKIKEKEDLLGEKMKKVSDSAKEKVKGLMGMEVSEERQSLVNVGIAVLVIAALGAYIYYSYGSSRNTED